MEKIPISKFAVALLSALVCSSSTYAQGIYQGSLRIDNIDDFAIDSESNEPLTFRFESPLDGFPASISWSASGGIQIVGGYGKGSYPCQLSTSIGTMSNVVILR